MRKTFHKINVTVDLGLLATVEQFLGLPGPIGDRSTLIRVALTDYLRAQEQTNPAWAAVAQKGE